MPFKPVNPKVSFPELEKEILSFWEKEKIFEKSLTKESPSGTFVFYEGPPTANGKPGLHHVLARAFKDTLPRYKTMRGFNVPRKAGWDTHGLPVELEIEKKLGISGKQGIEKIKPTPEESIVEFNRLCKESVWAYKNDWEEMTKRMGFWVDMKNPYITYENNYIESVWWVISQAYEKGLLYKGFKIVPYCPRCGTALSSHELAQGYKEVEEKSIYIEFKIKPGQKLGETDLADKTSFLVWTTTPWTLPGNVALAVGESIEYVLAKGGESDEHFILAKNRFDSVFKGNGGEIIKEFFGKELLDLEYEPLYSFIPLEKRSHFVISGDFVSDSDGTGIVHIAPAFGEDDYNVGKENNLPNLMTLDKDGRFLPEIGEWAGQGAKESDPAIIEDLEKRSMLFGTEMYKHEYPFCWRCDTALLYYPKDSWFIEMSKLKNDLVKNNDNINWIPESIKKGRFGEWLEGVKDWAISRDRYWGSPLPIWECQGCGKTTCIGSVADLKEKSTNFDEVYKKRLKNDYILLRHGEAEHNINGILDTLPEKSTAKLTDNGKKQIEGIKEKINEMGVNLIFASPLLRTKETAQIIADGKDIVFDDRLAEINGGVLDGKSEREFEDFFGGKRVNKFSMKPENGESWKDIEARIRSFIEETESKYEHQKILLVSHGDPLLLFEKIVEGWDEEKAASTYIMRLGSMKLISPLQIDLHRPFIDKIKIKCECGGEMTRTPEVMDVWLDSGTMPYSQWHYPFENKELIDEKKFFPADYICEAVDQTRGWFYTLHAVSTFLGSGNCFKNVICLGHILDSKGKKMSKTKGNMIEPMSMAEEHGFDAIRWFMYTNNQPGEPKLVGEENIKDQVRRFLLILWNTYSFFVTYANIRDFQAPKATPGTQATNIFDKWLVSRKNQTIKRVTECLEKYDIFTATRTIEAFVVELSTWYLRRNKKREDAEFLQVLHETLVDVAKMLAPFTPFVSEEIYRNLTGEESVHLSDWPALDETLINEKLERDMVTVQNIVEAGHAKRKENKIKVRQPLASATAAGTKISEENIDLGNVIVDELNIKEIKWSNQKSEKLEVGLDMNITPELKSEGMMREIVRLIQDARKEARYAFSDQVGCFYQTDSDELKNVIAKFSEEIKKQTILSELTEGSIDGGDIEKEGSVDGQGIRVVLKK